MSTKQPKLSIKYAVICDDIRREDNGKQILIGVYSEDIIVSSFPAQLNLAMWLQCKAENSGEVNFDFRALRDGNDEIFKGSAKIQVPTADKLLSIAVTPLIVQIISPGTLTFQVRQHQGRWQTVKKMGVGASPKKS